MNTIIKSTLLKKLQYLEQPEKLSFEQSERYRVLEYVLVTVTLFMPVIGVFARNFGTIYLSWVMIASPAISILGIVVNRRGKYTLAGVLFLLEVFAIIIIAMIDGAGLSDPGIIAFPVLIFLSAFILGRPGLFASLGCAIASIYVLLVLDRTGLLTLHVQPSLDQAVVLTSILLFTGFIMLTISSIWEKSLAERARSETRYHILFEDSPVALWEVDASDLKKHLTNLAETEGKDLRRYFFGRSDRIQECVNLLETLDINRGMIELLGYASREELPANKLAFFLESSYQVFLDAYLILFQGERHFEAEMPFRKSNGENIVSNLRLSIPLGFEETWSRVQISLTDITRRKTAEARLVESEARYQTLSGATFEGIIISKGELILDANEQLAEMVGLPLQEIIGQNPLFFLPLEERELPRRAIASGESLKSEYHLIRNDGQTIIVEGRGRSYEVNGEMVRITNVRDITERKQAEETLRKSEEKFSKAFYDSTAVMALSTFEGDRFIDINETFLKMFGYERDEVIGRTASELGIWENITNRPQLIDPSGGSIHPPAIEVRLWAKNKQIRIVYASFREIYIGDERCVLSTGVDITELKQTEERLFDEMARSSALARTAARLNTQLDLDRVLESICEEIVAVLKVPAAAILIDDPQKGRVRMGAAHGLPQSFEEQFQPIPRETFFNNGLPDQEPVVVQHILSHPDLINAGLYVHFNIHTVLWIAMFHQEQLLGVMDVYFYEEDRSVSESEISLLKTLSELGAQAIFNSRLYHEVLESREHLQQVSQQLVEVQEAERRALALELHDELGQVLNGIKISLDMIPILPDPSTREQLLGKARSATGNLIGRVRQMSLDLRPSLLDEMGLHATLTWLFRSYQEQTGSQVEFQWTGPEQRFPPPVEITAYRIIQEALNNIIRHASNKQAAIIVWTDETCLNLIIEDKGDGFDVEKAFSVGKSTGLSGMRERARLLGGELTIESILGSGTTISASIPMADIITRKKIGGGMR